MKNRFYAWLGSIGQEPKKVVLDLFLYFAKFFFLTWLVIYPVSLVGPFIFPAPPAIGPKPAKLPPEQFLALMLMNVYFFFAVMMVLMFMGSWHRLVGKFPAPKKFSEGQLFKRQSGAIGGMNYSRILHFRVADSGLYLKCAFPFYFLQRPMLIPWKEIKAINDVRVLFSKSTFIIVGSPKISSIILQDKKLISKIREMWEAKR